MANRERWTDDPVVDDHALLAAVRSGDAVACRQLVERETGPLFRLAVRILGHPVDAEDVVQETFLAAFRSLDTYRGEGSLRGWLMRIATRVAYRRASAPSMTDIETIPEPVADARGSDPSDATLDDETRAAVRLAVAALPDPYREVIVLRYFAGLAPDEIAAALDRPLNTTKSQLQRGLRRLRAMLVVEVAA